MKLPARVTLANIAREAGVSKTSASRILNNRMAHQFSEKTRSTVLAIAKRTAYRRHLAGRGFAHHPSASLSRTVTVINSGPLGWDMKDPANFFTQVLYGVMQEAQRHHLLVNLAGGLADAGRKLELLKRVAGGVSDGVLTCGLVEPEVSQFLLDQHIPAVHMGDGMIPPGIPTVYSDNVMGGLLAARHLIGLKHRRLAFIGLAHDPAREYFSQRLAGFTRGLQEAGLPLHESLVVMPSENLASELDRALSLPRPPTAFFGGVQGHAMRVLTRLQSLGVRVPQESSVIGFDNFPNSETTTPPLTVIDVPRETIGRTALRLLLRAIQDPVTEPITVLVPVSLVSRASTGPCPPR
jgi:LacI family transcriptional regulator